jgi:ferredoxin-like protein FixX
MKRADLSKGESHSKKQQASGNAFERLMQKRQSAQKRPCARKSRFVACPAGCGQHIREENVNEHLDRCLGATEAVEPTQSEAKATEQVATVDPAMTREPTEPVTFCPTPDSSSSTVSPESNNAKNAFSHMMKQSQRVFSAKESQPLRQRFHLHPDGRLSWTCTEDVGFVEDPGSLASNNASVLWSAKVLLKASRMVHGQPQPKPDAPQSHDVELTVSTAMVFSGTSRRLVRKHSRLSVSASW